ncbi:ribosome biogenesis GTPase A [Ruminococcaceae bacterium KH2T8]|nr:ribosome biogenesis GTPase A [Ruminococcaceae bacterium KH2T8]
MSDDIKSINWFPGHMRKALNETVENLKKVDCVYETCDARIPFSSRNPELDKLVGNKPRVVILNKADLADPDQTDKWIAYFKDKGISAIPMEANRKKGLDKLYSVTDVLCGDIIEKAKAKGMQGKTIKVLVVGVPNTGKSTLINGIAGRKAAVTGNKPGVTRNVKWIRTEGKLDLMDMPGVLWPKIATKRSQLVLTATGAIKSEVTDTLEVAYETCNLLWKLYPKCMSERYNIAEDYLDTMGDEYDRFLAMGKGRGCLMSGGRIDEERFARLLLDDLRSGRIGRITLESPDKPES